MSARSGPPCNRSTPSRTHRLQRYTSPRSGLPRGAHVSWPPHSAALNTRSTPQITTPSQVHANSLSFKHLSLLYPRSTAPRQVYAYTRSPVTIAVMELFVRREALLPNLFVGAIRRDSILGALQKWVGWRGGGVGRPRVRRSAQLGQWSGACVVRCRLCARMCQGYGVVAGAWGRGCPRHSTGLRLPLRLHQKCRSAHSLSAF